MRFSSWTHFLTVQILAFLQIGSAVFKQPDVSFRNSSNVWKETCRPPTDLDPIRFVNSTYKVRGDTVTTQQLLLFSGFDEWDSKWMINAPFPPAQSRHMCLQFNLLTWATHRKDSVHVCVYMSAYVCTGTKEPLSPYSTTGEWHHLSHCGTAESWD